MSAPASPETGSFWMIMSMLTFATASAVAVRPAMPGRVGDPLERDARLLGGVRDGSDERLFHGLLFLYDHGTGLVGEARSGSGCARRGLRGVLDGAQLQDAGARGDISSISSKETTGSFAGSRGRSAGRR